MATLCTGYALGPNHAIGEDMLLLGLSTGPDHTCPVCGATLPEEPAEMDYLDAGTARGMQYWDICEAYVCGHCGTVSHAWDSYAVPFEGDA